jgi:peptidyl-tRNA hydrolase ICT1
MLAKSPTAGRADPVGRMSTSIPESRITVLPTNANASRVNSKAQLRVPLDRLLPLVPAVMHGAIRTSQYYADKTNTLLIQADDSRKQGTNKDACYRKLHDLLLDTGNRIIPGETSEEQKEKVKTLKKHENESRLKMKKLHSNKKASRSNRSGD